MRQGPETVAQIQIYRFLRDSLPEDWLIWHTPNGGLRHPKVAMQLVEMGVVAGIPDLIILGPDKRIIFVEIKAKKGRLTEGQLKIKAWSDKYGVPFYVVKTLDEVTLMCDQLGLPIRQGQLFNPRDPNVIPTASNGPVRGRTRR